jgi:hypothetical protein
VTSLNGLEAGTSPNIGGRKRGWLWQRLGMRIVAIDPSRTTGGVTSRR